MIMNSLTRVPPIKCSFLDNPLQYLRCARMIPRAVPVDDGRGTLLTDLETIGFCPINATFACQVQFSQASLQVFPRLQAERLV